jgi:hypothetical protein
LKSRELLYESFRYFLLFRNYHKPQLMEHPQLYKYKIDYLNPKNGQPGSTEIWINSNTYKIDDFQCWFGNLKIHKAELITKLFQNRK